MAPWLQKYILIALAALIATIISALVFKNYNTQSSWVDDCVAKMRGDLAQVGVEADDPRMLQARDYCESEYSKPKKVGR